MNANSPVDDFHRLIEDVRQCRACADVLPLGPRPVFQMSPSASILIASQAPGTRAHKSGIPFSDASGQQLRKWMGVSADEFYDSGRVAIVPMAFCYPGRGASGDAPPSRECATLWRGRLLEGLAELRLTLLVGTYAQVNVLGPGRMTDRVRDFESYLPRYFPLPHPSWRSLHWAAEHPWFQDIVLPKLRQKVADSLRR